MRITGLNVINIKAPGVPRERGVGRTLCNPLDMLGMSDFALISRGEIALQLVEIVLEDGTKGYGQVGLFDGAAGYVISYHLRSLIMGRSVFTTTLLWEIMYKGTQSYGRNGVVMAAIAAVDIALWDAKGKLLRQSIAHMLGGPLRSTIPVYASRLYASDDIDAVCAEARAYVNQGFEAVKMRLGYGPVDGRDGFDKNCRLLYAVRDAIGDATRLMVDVYMSWDFAYCMKMMAVLREVKVYWLEEPVSPDRIECYHEIRELAHVNDIMIAGGEHEYSRWGVLKLLRSNGVDILQVDVNRCGGFTEAQRIWTLADIENVLVIPHGGQMHNYHMVASHTISPFAEYFPRPLGNPDRNEMFWFVWDRELEAKGGVVVLPDSPGLGIVPNWDAIEEYILEENNS